MTRKSAEGRIAKFKAMLGEQVTSYFLSAILGVVITVALFHYTSPPTRSSEVRSKLTEMARVRLESQLSSQMSKLTFDSVAIESLDLSASNSYFVYGTAQTIAGAINRFLMVFEPSSQSLIDKLAGRPGFYGIGFWAIIPGAGDDEVVASNVHIEDIDRDGIKDIFVHLKSSYADGVSKGLLILKKDTGDAWHLMGLPSFTKRMYSIAAGESPLPKGIRPATPPKLWFSSDSTRQTIPASKLKEYKGWKIDESEWRVIGSTGNSTFWMIRNGTKVRVLDHPYSGYKHIGVLANVYDGEPIQGPHHLMVNFFKIEGDSLRPDPMWNWSYPMLSDGLEDSLEWGLSEFQDAGVSVHVVGRTVFGQTEFGRVDTD